MEPHWQTSGLLRRRINGGIDRKRRMNERRFFYLILRPFGDFFRNISKGSSGFLHLKRDSISRRSNPE